MRLKNPPYLRLGCIALSRLASRPNANPSLATQATHASKHSLNSRPFEGAKIAREFDYGLGQP